MKKRPPPKKAAITIQLNLDEKELIKKAAKMDQETPANWAKMVLLLATRVRIREAEKQEGEAGGR